MSESRTVVVTGGSRGLGAGLVRALLDDGHRVATCSRSRTPDIDAWSGDPALRDRFYYSVVDMVDREACDGFVKDVLDRFGDIDVLVNNAGVAIDGVLGLFDDSSIDAVVDLNLKGTVRITKRVVRHMLPRGTGRIVNVSSIVGLAGYRGLSVYGATKAALDGFTRALARELGPRGITVNSIAPGYLRTEMTHGLDETQLEQIVRRTPMGRLGEPADVVAALRYLISPEAEFVTGHVLVVDGGLTA
jgi:3-oxoacyl-[acyl-carrier protein] reductase